MASKWQTEDLYQELFFVPRYYEVDEQQELLVPCMLRYMQETALQQIIRIKLSYWDMKDKNVTWIFRRGQLLIYRLPKFQERVKSVSYANHIERFLTHRNYKIYSNADELLAAMTSEWVLVNYKTQRICRIEDVLGEIPIYKLDNDVDFSPFKIKPSDQIIHDDIYKVRKYDLDFNGHVNNACYSEWILESLPNNFATRKLKDYQIHFKSEALLGENLIVEHTTSITEDRLYHRITNMDSGLILCLAKSTFY